MPSGSDQQLLIGADVGGTTTRVAVADRGGRVLAVAEQPAGNPNAVGVKTSAARIRAAIESALRQAQGSEYGPAAQGSEYGPAAQGSEYGPAAQGSEYGPAAQGSRRTAGVAAILLGMAGFGTAEDAGEDFVRAAIPDGIGVRPRIVSDLAVAYASATPAARGTVLIAGTGSSAADIDAGEIVHRRGGWGWLLGDEGAGFWLGREAVRQALAELEHGVVRGALTRQLIDALGIDDPEPLTGLLRVPYLGTPVELARLAPIVTGLVDSDPAAAAICARAAGSLADLVLDLQPMPGRPIVVAGSVLQAAGPIRSAFTERVRLALASPVLDARSGLVGALWLAAGTTSEGAADTRDPDPAIHRQLLTSTP